MTAAAPVVLGLADVAFRPSRLVLTSAAFAMAGAVVSARGAEVERWRDLSLATDPGRAGVF